MFKIFGIYMLNKYIKCNFGGQRCGTSTIVGVRRLKVKNVVSDVTDMTVDHHSAVCPNYCSYPTSRKLCQLIVS